MELDTLELRAAEACDGYTVRKDRALTFRERSDKILTEKEVHALVQTVEKYLDRPGSEGVREIVNDYDAFTGFEREALPRDPDFDFDIENLNQGIKWSSVFA